MLEDGGESASRPCPLAKLCFAFFYGLWYRICATKVIKDGKRYGIITGMAENLLQPGAGSCHITEILAELFLDREGYL